MSKKDANVINRLWYHAVSLMLCVAIAIIFILPTQIPDIAHDAGSLQTSLDSDTQIKPTSYILSTEKAHETNLVPFIHVTPIGNSYKGTLTSSDFVQLFRTGLSGRKMDSPFIRLSKNHDSYWLLTRITNPTDNKRWVLDVGKRLDGRIGGFKELKIFSINSNEQSISTIFDSSNYSDLEQRTIYSHFIPIEIPSHSTTLLGIYISSPTVRDLVTSIRFYSFSETLKIQDYVLTSKNMVPFLLISFACLFTLIFCMKKDWLYIYCALFFLGNISLLAIENRAVVEENSWELQSLFIHFIPHLTLILGLIFSKFFCFIKETHPISNVTIYALSAILLFLSLLTHAHALDEETYSILSNALSFISLFALTSICAFQTLENRNGSGLLAIGWLIQLATYTATELATYSFIDQTAFMLNAKCLA